MDETIQKNILHELQAIKRLLAHKLVTGIKQAEQISKLNSAGFGQTEIAALLGTTKNTVNVTLNRLKKSKKKKVSE